MRLIPLILLLISSYAQAKPIVVAVIDTGFGKTSSSLEEKHLCKYGHKDFTHTDKWAKMATSDRVPLDIFGHGTNIVGLIDKNAGNSRYCIVVIKAFGNMEGNIIRDSEDAIGYAISLKADIINYSAGGAGFSSVEYKEIKEYLDNGGIFVAAAGNDNMELISGYQYYPAMYDPRIVVVGNKEYNNTRHSSSNYGKLIRDWEYGVDAEAFGITLTGSSQSAAVCTGKIVNKLKRKNGK